MAGFGGTLRDKFRTLLNIRRPRKAIRRGPRPSIGSRIACDDVRMTVQAGMTQDLWNFLQILGWREITFKGDRRRYRDISTDWANQLIDAPPERRQEVLDRAIGAAVVPTRPTESGGSNSRPRAS